MVWQTLGLRIKTDDFQFAVSLHLREIHAPAARVAKELALALFVSEQDGLFSRSNTAGEEVRHQQGLAGAGGSADERDAVAEETAAAHFVNRRIAAGHPDHARLLLKAQR